MRLLLAALLLTLLSCTSGGGGQHACLPVRPVGSIAPPPDAELVEWRAELAKASYARWGINAEYSVSLEMLDSVSVRDRQLYAFQIFSPLNEDLDIKVGKPSFTLTTMPNAAGIHDGAAEQIASWMGYE